MSSTSSSLRSRSFLITGATDGIGRHTSQRLASDGHSLLIHGRKSSSDQNVVSLLRDLESRGAKHVSYVQADLGDLEQVLGLAEDVMKELRSWQSLSSPAVPALDCLINNAGVFDPTPRHSTQGYDMTMAVNVLAPFVLTRRLLPCLIRGEDVRIITTSSISQSRTSPDLNSLFARKTMVAITTTRLCHTQDMHFIVIQNWETCYLQSNLQMYFLAINRQRESNV
jgi:NAD(P)-dependent dehydrogenase (short-subunit alcohol dehydrogenase family)